MSPKRCFIVVISLVCCSHAFAVDDFPTNVQPLLKKYCVKCHNADEANADIDFTQQFTSDLVEQNYAVWESMTEQLRHNFMPPEDEPQPTQKEKEVIYAWYEKFANSIEPQPAAFAPRRLSAVEYRDSLRSVLGFDLEVAIIEAEQTRTQRSRVLKQLPTDPPGKSGFQNDTHANPLTLPVWNQYSILVDAGLEELFSPARRKELQVYTGPIEGAFFSNEQAKQLIAKFAAKAWRRPVLVDDLTKLTSRVNGLTNEALVTETKLILKSTLMSPRFLYRGLQMPTATTGRQKVDAYELAERLSYFLWADMPDAELLATAADGAIFETTVMKTQIERMLASPKARSLTDDFATQWLALDEIEKVSDNEPLMVALKSQPLDFMHYLFTENRPLLELIDSETAFVSAHTARMYGADAKQMQRYSKQKGIEIEIVPNQRIKLIETGVRGGILTMPGVLAMNKGPIIRGVWVLQRILGDDLPEPPANVGQVQGNKRGENLTFRERFEQHRANASCAVCHDKIDPLGFALEGFNGGGAYMLKGYRPTKKELKRGYKPVNASQIDTSGKLPSGETFQTIEQLKKILATTQREQVIRNMVRQTMAYALCRKLKAHDQPTVQAIVTKLSETNGTWQDLFVAIATSPQFQQTIVEEKP